MHRMALSLRRGISSIERNLPVPSNCRSLPPSLAYSQFIVISFAQQGPDAFYTGEVAENIVSGKLLPSYLSFVRVVLKEIDSPDQPPRRAVGS